MEEFEEKDEIVLVPLCSLTACDNESESRPEEHKLVEMISAYYELLEPGMRASFAPPESLVQTTMGNYDPQFYFLISKD